MSEWLRLRAQTKLLDYILIVLAIMLLATLIKPAFVNGALQSVDSLLNDRLNEESGGGNR